MKCSAIGYSVASALAMMAATPEAGAAAFALYEQGISGLGNAYAGAAAVAEDATTVWWNPAGMARLSAGKHFALGGPLIAPSLKFSDRGSQAPVGRPLGGTGGNAGSSVFVPSMFFTTDVSPRINLGIGVTAPFGLMTEYDPTWLGRFQGIKSEVQTLNINPSLSYKVSDAASVGFGISYMRAEIDLLSAVNFGVGEGQNHTKVDGDAWGFNVGALFNVAPTTQLGVHYRSSVDIKLTGDTTFSGTPVVPQLSNGKVKLDLKTPGNVAFSVAHRLNQRTTLLGDVTWWQWSKIQQLPLIRTDGSLSGSPVSTLTFDFKDTWRLSGGASYKLSEPWTLKFGVAYDPSPVRNAENRTVRLPDNDRYWLSAGAKYQVSRNGAFDLAYTFVKAKDADINNNQGTGATGRGFVNGTYKVQVHIFGIQYQHSL